MSLKNRVVGFVSAASFFHGHQHGRIRVSFFTSSQFFQGSSWIFQFSEKLLHAKEQQSVQFTATWWSRLGQRSLCGYGTHYGLAGRLFGLVVYVRFGRVSSRPPLRLHVWWAS